MAVAEGVCAKLHRAGGISRIQLPSGTSHAAYCRDAPVLLHMKETVSLCGVLGRVRGRLLGLSPVSNP